MTDKASDRVFCDNVFETVAAYEMRSRIIGAGSTRRTIVVATIVQHDHTHLIHEETVTNFSRKRAWCFGRRQD